MSGYVGNVLWMNRDFGREFGLPYDQLDIQFFSFSLFYPFQACAFNKKPLVTVCSRM